MNIKRINASERFKIYGRLFIIGLMLVLLFVIPFTLSKFKDTSRLDKYTCKEIYDMSTSYRDQTRISAPQYIIYYLENCYDKEVIK